MLRLQTLFHEAGGCLAAKWGGCSETPASGPEKVDVDRMVHPPVPGSRPLTQSSVPTASSPENQKLLPPAPLGLTSLLLKLLK